MIGVILEKTVQHVQLSFLALVLAATFAVPMGLFLSRWKRTRLSQVVIRAVALIQTIPGLAMIALIVSFFAMLSAFFTLPTIGFFPGVVTLFLYALSPILLNTYTGIRQTSPMLIDVGRGLGMTPKQVLFQVEIPHAIPTIIAGLRIAGVWTIGMGTLASLIGAGGLGDLIMQGLRCMNPTYILAGTLPAALLAIVYECGMSGLQKWLEVSRG